MNASLDATDPGQFLGRPRLTPGVPAGGIAAIAVTAAVIVWGLVASIGSTGDQEPHQLVRVAAPLPPLAPLAPVAPLPPLPPGEAVVIDVEAIHRSVHEAMRSAEVASAYRQAFEGREIGEAVRQAMAGIDIEAITREANAAAMAEIDIDAITRQANEAAMSRIDVEAISRAANAAAMSQIDVEAITREANRVAMESLAAARQGLAAANTGLAAAGVGLEGPLGQTIATLREARQVAALQPGRFEGGTITSLSDERVVASFAAPEGLRLLDTMGEIGIVVGTGGEIRLEADGAVGGLRAAVVDGRLIVAGGPGAEGQPADGVEMRLVVPKEAAILVSGHVGDFTMEGDYRGDLTLEMRRGDANVERVGSATVRVLEAADIDLGHVLGRLAFGTHGAVDLNVERAETVSLEIVGQADVTVGRIANGLTLVVPGHGNVHVDRLDGPVRAALLGAGEVTVVDGTAESLQVAVAGPADFHFGGTAASPQVMMTGPGSVEIAHFTGTPKVQRVGSGSVNLGE